MGPPRQSKFDNIRLPKTKKGSDGAVTKDSAAGHTNGSAKGASRVPERKPIKINYSLALKFDDRGGKAEPGG